jgi:hypothetical protein
MLVSNCLFRMGGADDRCFGSVMQREEDGKVGVCQLSAQRLQGLSAPKGVSLYLSGPSDEPNRY